MSSKVSRTTEALAYLGSFGVYFAFVRLVHAARLDLRPDSLGAIARTLVGTDRVPHSRSDDLKKGEKGPKGGDAKSQADDAPFEKRAMRLLMCIVGIQVSYLCWGVMQERIMTRPYGPEAVRFQSSRFLVFSNRLAAFLLADLVVKWQGGAVDSTPPFRFSLCATSNILSSVCQYEALKFVSFPTQVLAKSCKMLPVMLMGYVVGRKRYPLSDWLVAVVVTAGVVVFKQAELADTSRAHARPSAGELSGGEAIGYSLIVGYIGFDSFTSNWQGALFKEYSVTPLQMMRQVNMFSVLFAATGLLLTAEAFELPRFFASHPDCALHVAMMSVCSAIGQLFIFFTIKHFGALAFATINTVRTMFSVVLSFSIFGHAINAAEAGGIALAFSALAAQVGIKWARQLRKRRPPPAVASGGGN